MTEAFTLDTSGDIFIPDPRFPDASTRIRWPDLDSFTQGYIEALFASVTLNKVGKKLGAFMGRAGFSDLAPETLARIIKIGHTPHPLRDVIERSAGRLFWRSCQEGREPAYPPLAPYLADDGKVYLREAGQ